MPVSQLLSSFNAGELSPYMDARSDVEKYTSGCRTLENFITLPYGGVQRRPGTEYLGRAKYGDRRCRLIGFNFSTTTRFVIEMGDLYLRFWSNGLQVMNPSNPTVPLEVASPYPDGHVRQVQYIQINDVMYFCHPSHPPQKLIRKADDDWEFGAVEWDWPPLLDENIENITINPGSLGGSSVALGASAPIFHANHVGAYWAIGYRLNSGAWTEVDMTGGGLSSPEISVFGAWEFTTYGNWVGIVVVERKIGGGNWEVIRTFKSKVSGERNVKSTGTEDKQCLLRVTWGGGSGTNAVGRIEVGDNRSWGIVKITAVASGTSATATVISPLAGGTATALWAEGAFSNHRGHPRAVALHEGRIFFAGTAYRPLSIWGSVINDFQNFRRSTLDDGGLFYSLSAKEANAVQWMESQSDLIIGTSGDEWTIGSSEADSALTPTNVRAQRQSSYGSMFLSSAIVNDVILFVQRRGRKIRELVYSFEKDGWVAPDLTVLAEHITMGEIVETAYQQQPDAIFWAVRGDGQLIGMTYERDQNVVGWHRHTTKGIFESVATIYGVGTGDEVWLSVRRRINGEDVRYIERFRPDFRETFDAQDKEHWWYLDCAKRFVTESEEEDFSGLGHLEGEQVDLLADGAASPPRTVEDGSITLQAPASIVLAGLPYESRLKPMRLEMVLQDGSSRGRIKRVHRLVASLYKSLGGQCSTDGQEWQWFYPREMSTPMDDSPSVFTGDREVHVAGNYSDSGDVLIRQNQPFPLTVLALVAKMDTYGD